MPLRSDEECWLRELDDPDPEKRCIGVVMLSGAEASTDALMEVADLMRDDDATVRGLVFDRLLARPCIPPEIGAVAHRFVRRIRYTDKRNHALALCLLIKADPTRWHDLVATQIDLMLSHEQDDDVRSLAHQLRESMAGKN